MKALYICIHDHKGVKGKTGHLYNVLLVAVIVGCIAVDTSVCERGFALMNNLKTARRSRMGGLLLRILMTICELGKEWEDPTKIPVQEIVNVWREASARGRYEHAMWRVAGLEEPSGKAPPKAQGGLAGAGSSGDGRADFDEEEQLQNLRNHPDWERM